MVDRKTLVLCTGVLVVALLTSGFVGGALADGGEPVPENVTTQDPDDVWVDPALEEDVETASANDEPVDVIVSLESFDHRAYEVSTADADDPDRRTASMKEHAERTRSDLAAYADATEGVEIESTLWIANAAVVTVDPSEHDVEQLARIDGVVAIEANSEFDLPEAPTEPTESTKIDADAATGGVAQSGTDLRRSMDAAESTQAELDWSVKRINADDVWEEYDTKGEGIKVAVLDTGVDASHPDIDLYTEDPSDPTYPGGWAEFNEDGELIDSEPYDSYNHGTKSAGTIAGGDARGAYVGVAPNVDLIATMANNSYGRLNVLYGIQWAIEEDADVMSMSINLGKSPIAAEAIRNSERIGVAVAAAAGNEGEGDSISPGNYYDPISVGATDENDDVKGYSSGQRFETDSDWSDAVPSEWPDVYLTPTVAAPTDGISTDRGGGYVEYGGTSGATPHVGGALALIQSATDKRHSPEEMEEALVETASKPDDWNDDDAQWTIGEQDSRYGHGIIDVKAAIEYLESGSGPSVETFEVQDASQPSSWWYPAVTDLTVDWSVDSSAQDVTVEVIDADGTTVATYDGVSGTEQYTEQGVYDEQFTIELTATDASGAETCKRLVGPADGDSTNFALEDCSPETDPGTAAFEATDIDVNATAVGEGEWVTVDIQVENVGDEAGEVAVVPTVDGEPRQLATAPTFDLAPGESAVGSVDVRLEDAGDRTIGTELDLATGVDEPVVEVQRVEFETTAVTVDETTIETGTTKTFEVVVESVGTAEGSTEVVPVVDGTDLTSRAQETGPLAPGETYSFTFDYEFTDPGEFPVETNVQPASENTFVTMTVEGEPAEAVFRTTDVTLGQQTIEPGEPLQIDAEIANVGDTSGTVFYGLEINGEERPGVGPGLTIDDGESKTVELSHTFEEEGEYELGLSVEDADGLERPNVTVTNQSGQPEYRMTDVSVDPSTVEPGQTFDVTAEITNVGDAAGSTQATLAIDGEPITGIGQLTDDLAPGESDTVSFAYSLDDEGEYTIGTDIAAAEGVTLPTLAVEDPGEPAFETTDVSVDPSTVEPGETFDVTAEITNVGDAAGSTQATLAIDGEPITGIGQLTDDLAPGESDTVSFAYSLDDEGEYTIGTDIAAAEGVTLPTLAVEPASDAEPELQTFDVQDDSVAGSWWDPGQAEFDIAWEVTHEQNAITDVSVTVTNLDRGIDREQYTVRSGSETYVDPTGYYDDEYGEQFRIRVEAVDDDGDSLCRQIEGPADGDSSNLQQSAC